MVIAFTPESSTFIAMEEIEFTIENLNSFVTDITGESGFEWAVEEQPEGGIQLVDYAAESSHWELLFCLSIDIVHLLKH